jgi:hypothetical protein
MNELFKNNFNKMILIAKNPENENFHDLSEYLSQYQEKDESKMNSGTAIKRNMLREIVVYATEAHYHNNQFSDHGDDHSIANTNNHHENEGDDDKNLDKDQFNEAEESFEQEETLNAKTITDLKKQMKESNNKVDTLSELVSGLISRLDNKSESTSNKVVTASQDVMSSPETSSAIMQWRNGDDDEVIQVKPHHNPLKPQVTSPYKFSSSSTLDRNDEKFNNRGTIAAKPPSILAETSSDVVSKWILEFTTYAKLVQAQSSKWRDFVKPTIVSLVNQRLHRRLQKYSVKGGSVPELDKLSLAELQSLFSEEFCTNIRNVSLILKSVSLPTTVNELINVWAPTLCDNTYPIRHNINVKHVKELCDFIKSSWESSSETWQFNMRSAMVDHLASGNTFDTVEELVLFFNDLALGANEKTNDIIETVGRDEVARHLQLSSDIVTVKRKIDEVAPKGDSNAYQATKHHKKDDVGAKPKSFSNETYLCFGCGSNLHKRKNCTNKQHEDYNPLDIPWKNSVGGKKWELKGWSFIPTAKNIENRIKNESARHDNNPLKGTIQYLNALNDDDTSSSFTLPMTAYVTDEVNIKTNVLLDTGALQGNYVSDQVAKELITMGAPVKNCNVTVTSCFKDDSTAIVNNNKAVVKVAVDKVIKFKLRFKHELSNEYENISLTACVVNNLSYDVIIGRPDIAKHDFTNKFRNHLASEPIEHHNVTESKSMIAQLYEKHQLLDYESDEDDIGDLPDIFPADRVEELYDLIPAHIVGSLSFQTKIRSLCIEYVDIFSREVRKQPADLPPFVIDVDDEQWYNGKNSAPVRPQNSSKEAEVEKQITRMLELGVISRAQEPAYSQVHMTPKKAIALQTIAWRFCIDFRSLNACTVSKSWPIPNIQAMLMRIGAKKPRVFGIIDMTSGYHQIPIDEMSRKYTAFICFMGVMVWNRLPMGPKGGGSHFQACMALMFAGLIYSICEVYMDDILIYADNEDKFITNLRLVFDRIRERKVTIHPDKCHLGMESVEFVGHEINATGMTFTQEKITRFLEIEKPITVGQLQMFLGTANYFRDHIHHHAAISKPLYELTGGMKNKDIVVWTDIAFQNFELLRKLIQNIPTLFFRREDSPVFLCTDACNYGIGAYLYQLYDGIEEPIAFMSKALNKVQQRWSTYELEAFAIFSALKKFEYIIGDVKFTLQTDHENLTFLNVNGSPKVKRWKLAIQEFNFDIEHIEGNKNVVADALSRLVPNNPPLIQSHHIISSISTQTIQYDDEIEPDEAQMKIITAFHGTNPGHFGVNKVMEKLRSHNHHWPFMRSHVKHFISTCPVCQKLSMIKQQVCTSKYITSTLSPMRRLCIDAMGPFPKSSNGDQYIIVVIDSFTRFVELYPAKDTTALEAARVLIIHFGRYGFAAELLSNNGTQFVNEIIASLTALLGVEHSLINPYSHEENGIVERANKEVLRHLRAILWDKRVKSTWNVFLPLVQRIMNASVHSSIGVTPASLLFGDKIDLDDAILHETKKPLDKPLHQWAVDMLQKQRDIIEIAVATQRAVHKAHLDKQIQLLNTFPIGTYVLAKPPESRMNLTGSNKLEFLWKGPMSVHSVDSDIYTLYDPATGKFDKVHASRLKQFKERAGLNPVDVSLQANDMYVVEKVVNHIGIKTKPKDLRFQIRWYNYGPEQDTLEQWKNLHDNEIVHGYLREKGMASIIPARYRIPSDTQPFSKKRKR